MNSITHSGGGVIVDVKVGGLLEPGWDSEIDLSFA